MKMSAASTSASPSSTPRSRRASFGGAWDEAASSESTWSTCARALDASAELLLRSGPALSMHTTPRRASTVDASSAAASHSASPKNAADALWLGILRVPLASLRALRRLEADVDVLVAATRGGDAPSTPGHPTTPKPPPEAFEHRYAVGMTEGLAPADRDERSKAAREAHFPTDPLAAALTAKLQSGQSMIAADRVHLLNAIAGVGVEGGVEDFDSTPEISLHVR